MAWAAFSSSGLSVSPLVRPGTVAFVNCQVSLGPCVRQPTTCTRAKFGTSFAESFFTILIPSSTPRFNSFTPAGNALASRTNATRSRYTLSGSDEGSLRGIVDCIFVYRLLRLDAFHVVQN